jgi:hypothetical protein
MANPITLSSATTTTCSWSSAPSFSASIAWPDYAVIIAEPDTANEEIMWLLGWTLGSTTGFVQRAAEDSPGGRAINSPISHSGVIWTHGPTARDFRSPATRLYLASSYS